MAEAEKTKLKDVYPVPENIKKMACRINEVGKDGREDFKALVNETIFLLIEHAKYEDEYLFPLADAKTDENMLTTIDKKNIPFETPKRGDKINFTSGIDVQLLTEK